ncbi:hypothetical protein D840_01007 [Enterococcus faecalis 20.SD.W.06]|nr:hypothetical protein HMPREF9500_02932 [Enterococcus faecalis TX0017]EGG59010.1 hypothetical protein HMPREF9520_00616 [Enterococcus faecalis TX1467]EPI05497.1 hypothetical protein D840_01007 [Enterococcus faecalis 20.SD.W.06]
MLFDYYTKKKTVFKRKTHEKTPQLSLRRLFLFIFNKNSNDVKK